MWSSAAGGAPPAGEQASPPNDSSISPERVFLALDGRWMRGGGLRWRVEVFSVTDQLGWRWIQVALHGGSRRMLTLRSSPADGVKQIVRTFMTWLASAEPSGDIPTVA